MQVPNFEADAIEFKNIGVNGDGELVASLERRTVDEVIIDKIRIDGNATYYNNRSKRLETSGTPYRLAEAESKDACEERVTGYGLHLRSFLT